MDDVANGAAELSDSRARQLFRRRLLAWYRQNARDLPWRRTRDPYCIWISEVMLQQTQVATVVPYYERFVRTFPDLRALAAAPEQQVLQHWEGLGYYRRARQLHLAAKKMVAEHKGEFPRQIEQVRELPGIGRYTAGAILSIALDQRHPILEANTLRVFSRLIGLREDPRRASAQRQLWSTAELLLPQKHVGHFNQALMELGSAICTVKEPQCDHCPVAQLCAARRSGLQQQIPSNSKKTRYEEVTEATVVIRREGALLLRQYSEGERWAGLWDFPRFPVAGELTDQALISGVNQLTGIRVQEVRPLTVLRHGVTRFRITLHCHEARYLRGKVDGQRLQWASLAQLREFPLSMTGRKLSRLLETSHQRHLF